jgi:ribose transport system substrate-binding protein
MEGPEGAEGRLLSGGGRTRAGFLKATAGASVTALAASRVPRAFAADSSKQIAVDLPFIQADVYPPLIAGAKEEAKRRGYTILQSASQLNLSAQLSELNTWIGEGVAAITAYPLDLKSFGPLVKRMHSKHEIFVAYGVPVPGADGSTLFNEKQASTIVGAAAGQYVKAKLGGKANVGLLVQKELETSRLRVDRAVAQMRKIAPGTKVVASAEAAAAPDALSATRTMLQAHPEINVMICINDQDLVGASQALKQLGRKPESVWMAGFDGSKAALQKLVSGDVFGATAALPLRAIGRTTVAVPANIIAGKGPRHLVTDYVLVTSRTKALAKKLIADYNG